MTQNTARDGLCLPGAPRPSDSTTSNRCHPKPSVRFLRPGRLSGAIVRSLAFAALACLNLGNALWAETAPATMSIGSRFLRFTMSASTGHCVVLAQDPLVAWGATQPDSPFGTVVLNLEGQRSRVVLGRCELESVPGQGGFRAVYHPDASHPDARLRIRFELLADQRTLQVSYQSDPELKIESLSPLSHVLQASRQGLGYLLVPVREGLLIPADSGVSFTHRFDTYAYEGCHMEMLGAVQDGSAVLATWTDPCVAAEVQTGPSRASSSDRPEWVEASLVLSKSAQSFRLHFLGQGDYVRIAKAYRQVAQDRGWVVTWDQKLKTNPERAKLFGAVNFKLWSALDRRMNEASTQEESVRTNWTFAEAAQVAEHLKRDLQLDHVLFTIGGWIHRGYDNQHPDILPTAPECGGDAAFADCARRVLQQGYLFCLHDNYQDIYRDSPSWDERWVMKTPDGKLAHGGHWAGGLAFLVCSKMGLELAERPQNLPAVKSLSHANAYFIDTTYAAGLQECFDPAHPLTRSDDMKWKQALSDYARGVFGVFGSECGREWAIPHSDFFEGLTGVSGHAYHDAGLPAKLGATVVPLFDLVYRDCIAMYGKYGYDPSQAALYVLQHISLARPLNYHSIPPHLYWKTPATAEQPLSLSPGVAQIVRESARRFKATYRWTVQATPAEPWHVFVHFTDSAGNIKFQNDYAPDPAVTQWHPGDVRQGPFTVTIPEGLSGTFEMRMGLFQPETGKRALLKGRRNRDRAYLVGKLTVSGDKIEFQPIDPPPPAGENLDLFTRADHGWAAGLDLTDRFLKNTYEILSPLNELTARVQMTSHEFLTPDRQVQRTVFGEGADAVTVTVNFGTAEYMCDSKTGGTLRLPSLGFLAEAPGFVAFYSRDWNGADFSSPSLFTLRSLDGQPLRVSHKIRIFHAFGDDKLRLRTGPISVQREAVIDPSTAARR